MIRKIRNKGRKLRDHIGEVSFNSPIDVAKMHGHMDIYLTDVKTGKVEEVHEDNMMTNALQEYFRNCGFLNYPNVNQNNMVVELLGGVMGFSEEISEDASIVHVPAGNKMIFNGSVGTVNNGNPTELGSFSETESGWQSDGSYVQTYDFSTSQANGTISCVCLTGKDYGFIGEGNSTSQTSHSQKRNMVSLIGSLTAYSVTGTLFNVDFVNSCAYTFKIEEREVGDEVVTVGILRKYRVPLTKVNIKGTQTDPILLSESTISLDSTFTETANKSSIACGGKLYFYNYGARTNESWGSGYTQHLWTITKNGTITHETVTNTTGSSDFLLGFGIAYFSDNYGIFTKYYRDAESNRNYTSSKEIFVWNRNNGTMQTIENVNGTDFYIGNSDPFAYAYYPTFDLYREQDGKIITTGQAGGFVIDGISLTASINNGIFNHISPYNGLTSFAQGLIRFFYVGNRVGIYRDQSYIASINNLDNPVVKTSEKTMKVIYRITFDEQ